MSLLYIKILSVKSKCVCCGTSFNIKIVNLLAKVDFQGSSAILIHWLNKIYKILILSMFYYLNSKNNIRFWYFFGDEANLREKSALAIWTDLVWAQIFYIQVWKRYEAQEFISMWGCSYHMQLTLENYFISCIKVVVLLCIKLIRCK